MLRKPPFHLAAIFFSLDVLWVIAIHVFSGTAAFNPLVQMWNYVHFPIRFFVEPMMFPVITTHPLSISATDLLLYEGICTLQSVLLGYGLGWLIKNSVNHKIA